MGKLLFLAYNGVTYIPSVALACYFIWMYLGKMEVQYYYYKKQYLRIFVVIVFMIKKKRLDKWRPNAFMLGKGDFRTGMFVYY